MEIIYSFLCVFLPCIIFFVVNKNKGSKLSFLKIMMFIIYLWMVFDITGVGGLSDIIYAPKGGDNTSIIRATINLIPFNEIEITFFLNILMLIPFGFLVPFIWKNYHKCYKTVLLGTSLSLLIELSQLITNRTTDINDLIANTFGTLIGYIIWKVFYSIFGKSVKKLNDNKKEVIWYILLSFFGLFFLYYPFWFAWNIESLIFG